MEKNEQKNYARIEAVVYIEMAPGETLEEAEDRFLKVLPDGMDIASYRSETWIQD